MSKSSARAAGRAVGRVGPEWEARTLAAEHLGRLRACLDAIAPAEIAAIAARLWQVVAGGGLVLVAGNGGSAATASHMALDWGKSTLGPPPRTAGRRVRTVCLSDPSPVLTAWANDEGYEGVFAEQVTMLAGPGDAVVLLSVSGSSPNILAAARAARAAGAAVIALTGARGSALQRLADLGIVVPSDDYQAVEDAHLAISHALTTCLRSALQNAAPPRRRPGIAGSRAAPHRARSSAMSQNACDHAVRPDRLVHSTRTKPSSPRGT
jgi:D-sedoheptulose 7-phosphate isomerase